mgnify:CR=1 FL=1
MKTTSLVENLAYGMMYLPNTRTPDRDCSFDVVGVLRDLALVVAGWNRVLNDVVGADFADAFRTSEASLETREARFIFLMLRSVCRRSGGPQTAGRPFELAARSPTTDRSIDIIPRCRGKAPKSPHTPYVDCSVGAEDNNAFGVDFFSLRSKKTTSGILKHPQLRIPHTLHRLFRGRR